MRLTCPSEKIDEATAIVQASFAPAPEEEIIKALYVMRRMTRGRDNEERDPESAEVELHAWARQLKDYPADVVISCLQDWPKRSQFWPTWFELRQRLERGVSMRRVMLHVLTRLPRDARSEQERLNESTPERRSEVVDKALRDLAEATSMGPFKANRASGDTVSGRTKPNDREKAQAEARLAEIENDFEPLSLSPLAKKALGLPVRDRQEKKFETEG